MKGAESMRIILKILALPFVVALTILGAVFAFILFLSAWIFYIAAFVFGLLGIAGIFQGDTAGGLGVVVIAFGIFILPTVAEWIADKLADLNDSLKLFMTT
jgi:hypothetical protein